MPSIDAGAQPRESFPRQVARRASRDTAGSERGNTLPRKAVRARTESAKSVPVTHFFLRGDPRSGGANNDSCFGGLDGAFGPAYDFDDPCGHGRSQGSRLGRGSRYVFGVGFGA